MMLGPTLIRSQPKIGSATLKNCTMLIQFQPRQEVCDAYFRRRQFLSGEYRYLHFHFDFAEGQSIKISPKYQNPFFNSKYQNIGCIDAEFCADFAIFLHFSRSTRIYWRKCVKMSKNAKILRTKFRKFSENQQKTVIF